jgi:hypothetical protein
MIKTFEFEGKKYQVDMDKLLAPALSGDWRPMKVDQFDFKPYQTGHFLSATANTCTAFQMMRPDAFASITCTADFGEPRAKPLGPCFDRLSRYVDSTQSGAD